MLRASLSCVANKSSMPKSYFSAHKLSPVECVSCAVTRTRMPDRRTVPASRYALVGDATEPNDCDWLTRCELGERTTSPETRTSAAIRSSRNPSAKYCCSTSPLRFVNGRTARAGFFDCKGKLPLSGEEGTCKVGERTAYARTGSSRFFSEVGPRSV